MNREDASSQRPRAVRSPLTPEPSPGGGGEKGGSAGPGVVANRVRRGFYLDSVVLMRLSASLSEREGVESASLMIGTPSNLAILDEAGLLTEDGRGTGPDDLVLAVRAESEETLAATLEAADAILDGTATGSDGGRPAGRLPGVRAACAALPGANLAIVSVPGPFAAREARRALAAGLHVLVFSDNVPVEEEVALKREARARGRLVMGPDCGTAIIAGVPLAFANRVRRGAIGVIAASGTGLQELSVLVHRGGGGISQGIGVGGRDLGDDVGGLGTFMALDALEADPDTRHVVIVSKPPGPRTEAALLARLAECPKPVTLCLIGRGGTGEGGGEDAGRGGDRDGNGGGVEAGAEGLPRSVAIAPTLRDAARLALGGGPDDKAGGSGRSSQAPGPETGSPAAPAASRPDPADHPAGTPARLPSPPTRTGRIVGLYSGGTLCAEGQAILRRAGLAVSSNVPIPGAAALTAGAAPRRPARSDSVPPHAGHAFIDLGADEYTAGRPHPMIEPAMRSGVLAETLADSTVAVVVLDVVLGTGSHPDPAAAVARALEAAPPDRPPVVASVCGDGTRPPGLRSATACSGGGRGDRGRFQRGCRGGRDPHRRAGRERGGQGEGEGGGGAEGVPMTTPEEPSRVLIAVGGDAIHSATFGAPRRSRSGAGSRSEPKPGSEREGIR